MSISNIIETLSTEDKQRFKSFLKKKNKRSDTKNLQLFEVLQQNPIPNNIDILLYGKPSRNAYHALSKRLHDNLIDYISQRSFETETSDELQVFKLLLTGRIFYEHKQHKPGKKLLQKAEKKALKIDLYTGLNEIYHTQIQYAHCHPEVDLEALIVRFRNNQKLHQQQENLNLAYAHIKQSLDKKAGTTPTPLHILLKRTFDQFDIQIDNSLTFKSLYQLLEIINTTAHLEHSFDEALPFFESVHKEISGKNVDTNKYRYYYIHFLYFMANAYFRNRQFETSEQYLDQMRDLMSLDHGKFFLRFRENELLLRTLNLNYTGKGSSAIQEIETYFVSKSAKKKVRNPDLTLSLTVFHLQQQAPKLALRSLNSLSHSDRWYLEKAGEDWLVKRDLVEIIIHIELENLNLVDALLLRFKRKNKALLKKEERLRIFVKTISHIHNQPEVVGQVRFRESVKKQFTLSDYTQEDIFMLSFFAWIKAKINQEPLYKTTLNLL